MGDEQLIVGAGPAGLTAAIHLAKRGHRVLVRERRRAPGLRHHGFQGIENWSHDVPAPDLLRRLEVRPDFLLRPIHEVLYYGPARREYPVRSTEPLFYLVRRGVAPDSLDSHLARQAEEAGARIEYNSPVTAAPPGAIVGVGPSRAMAIAKGIVFRTNAPDIAMCIVDPRIAPKAYTYLLTHEGVGTLAVMLTEDFRHVGDYLTRAIEAFRRLRSFSISDETTFGGAGGINLTGRCIVSGHMRVGECAGAQDALWGFGLLFAMESGHLAARCADEGIDYARLYRRRMLKRIRRLLVSRWMFERVPLRFYELFMKQFANASDPRAFLRRLYGGAPWLSAFVPLAKRDFEKRLQREKHALQEEHCEHDDCNCVRCQARRCLAEPST